MLELIGGGSGVGHALRILESCAVTKRAFPGLRSETWGTPALAASAFGELGFDGGDEFGSVGRGVRGEAIHHFAAAADKEFLEVPENLRLGVGEDAVALELLGEGHFGDADGLGLRGDEGGVKGMLLRADDGDFAEEREFDVVVVSQKVWISSLVPGSWLLKSLAGKPAMTKALAVKLLVDLFERFVLRREAALAGNVDDENYFALELGEGCVFCR